MVFTELIGHHQSRNRMFRKGGKKLMMGNREDKGSDRSRPPGTRNIDTKFRGNGRGRQREIGDWGGLSTKSVRDEGGG